MLTWTNMPNNAVDRRILHGRLGAVGICDIYADGLIPEYPFALRMYVGLHTVSRSSYENLTEAKEEAEKILQNWLNLAGLKVVE